MRSTVAIPIASPANDRCNVSRVQLGSAVPIAGYTTTTGGLGLQRRVLVQSLRRTLIRQRPAERAQATVEFLGVLPVAFLILAIVWQLGLWAVTATLTSHAADEAARAAGIGGTTAEMRDDALRSVPSWFRDNMNVSQTAIGSVQVTSSMPVLTPMFTVDGLDLTSEAPIAAE
jgi:hypothetical protein